MATPEMETKKNVSDEMPQQKPCIFVLFLHMTCETTDTIESYLIWVSSSTATSHQVSHHTNNCVLERLMYILYLMYQKSSRKLASNYYRILKFYLVLAEMINM